MKSREQPEPMRQPVMQKLHAALADWSLQKQWCIENTIPKQ
jgi:hypothetical protein